MRIHLNMAKDLPDLVQCRDLDLIAVLLKVLIFLTEINCIESV